MAKVSFNKLKCKLNDEVKVVEFAGEKIEIKQYLPIQDKLKLIGSVITQAHEQDSNYSNPVKVSMLLALEIIFKYTNINFTDKQLEDLPKLYDSVYSSGLLASIQNEIPEQELVILNSGVQQTIKAVYEYQNSILGLVENLKYSFNENELNMNTLQQQVKDLQNNEFVSNLLDILNQE